MMNHFDKYILGLGIAGLATLGSVASAQCPTDSTANAVSLDGTKDATYGTALATQTVQTEFGNASNGFLNANGSELDGLYITNDASNLYVMLTGNLEGNGNSIVLFFDRVQDTTGVSVLPDIAASKDGFFDSTPQSAIADGFGQAIMPTGFNADIALVYKHFMGFGSPTTLDFVAIHADFRGTPVSTFTADTEIAGSVGAGAAPAASSFTLAGQTYNFAINNSNTLGVDGGNAAATPGASASVTTGFELAVPLAALGASIGDDIKLFAVVTNGSFADSTYVSNQLLPPLPTPRGNLANRAVANTLFPAQVFDFTLAATAIVPACYQLKAAPLATENWEMYE